MGILLLNKDVEMISAHEKEFVILEENAKKLPLLQNMSGGIYSGCAVIKWLSTVDPCILFM